MKLAVIGTGSRGDCTPMMALSLGLQGRGHQVRFLALEEYRGVAEGLGLDFRALPGKSAAFFGGPAGVAMRSALARSPQAYLRFFDTYLPRFLEGQLNACLAACQGVDAIISWPWLRVAPNVARGLGVPCVIASPTPPLYLSTQAFACPYTRPSHDSGQDVDRSWADARASFAAGQATIEAWRSQHGHPALTVAEELAAQQALPHLLGISPTLLPKPEDWGDHVEVVGHFALPADAPYAPPPTLERFLAAGPPPVGLGFSSSVARDPRRLWTTIAAALERSGRRAVVVGGYAALGDLPSDGQVLVLDQVPYPWLLPRLSGFVHHGGLGTTHLALAAGCPSLVVPFGWDQPLWARRVHALQAGPAPLPGERLQVGPLMDGMDSLCGDPTWAAGAARASDQMRGDGGATLAAHRIDHLLSSPPRPAP